MRNFSITAIIVAVFAAVLLSFAMHEGKGQWSKVVAAKAVKMENGSTQWVMAFTDGSAISVDFGAYTKYNAGDTVCVERNAPHNVLARPAYPWIIVTCR